MFKIEIDISNKCRACLSDENQMHDLFTAFDQNLTLAEILETHTSFEVSSEDGLSQFLCDNCTKILIDFHNFRTDFEANEKYMKSLLNENGEKQNIVIQKPNEEVDDEENEIIFIESQIEETENIQDPTIHDNVEEEILSEDDGTVVEKEENSEVITAEAYACNHCGDNFLYKAHFEKHMKKKHQETNINSDSHKHQLTLTVCSTDQIPNELQCKYCKEYFDTKDNLDNHISTHKKHICDQCGDSFVKKSYLRDHYERHEKVNRYTCQFCSKSFQRRTVYLKHRKIHTHPRQCVCERCGKRFNDLGALRTHNFLIHQKIRNFKCHLCQSLFPLKSTLEKHLRRHAENREKEFVCNVCSTAYNDKSSLNRHFLIKHSENHVKEICEICQKEYTTKTNLLKHVRKCHGNITT